MEPPSVLLGAAFPILASPQAWARGGGGGQARGGQVGGKYILNAKQLTIWANPLECQTITFDNLEKHIWYLFKKSVSQWGSPTNGNHFPLLSNQKFPQISCEQLLVEFVFVEVRIGNFLSCFDIFPRGWDQSRCCWPKRVKTLKMWTSVKQPEKSERRWYNWELGMDK